MCKKPTNVHHMRITVHRQILFAPTTFIRVSHQDTNKTQCTTYSNTQIQNINNIQKQSHTNTNDRNVQCIVCILVLLYVIYCILFYILVWLYIVYSSSVGATSRCGLWPVEQYCSTFVTISFYCVELLAPRQTPNLEDQGIPFLSGSSPLICLAWEALPVAYATASIALRIMWPHKPHHNVKVRTSSGGISYIVHCIFFVFLCDCISYTACCIPLLNFDDGPKSDWNVSVKSNIW